MSEETSESHNDADEPILGSDDPKIRDLTVVRTCENCGRRYHPRKGGYKPISRFCSQACSRDTLRSERWVHP